MKQTAGSQQGRQEGIRQCLELIIQLPSAGCNTGSAGQSNGAATEQLSADQILGIHRLSGILLAARTFPEAEGLADSVMTTADLLLASSQQQAVGGQQHTQQAPGRSAAGAQHGRILVLKKLCDVLVAGEPASLLASHCLLLLAASHEVAMLLCGGQPAPRAAAPHLDLDLLSTLAGLLKGGASRGLEPLLYVQCLHLLVHLVQAKAAPAEPLTGLPTNSESLGSGHQGLSQRLAASIGKCAAAAIGSTSTEVQGLGVELVQALLMLHNGCTHALARPELKEALKATVGKHQADSGQAQGLQLLQQQLLQAQKLLDVLTRVQGHEPSNAVS